MTTLSRPTPTVQQVKSMAEELGNDTQPPAWAAQALQYAMAKILRSSDKAHAWQAVADCMATAFALGAAAERKGYDTEFKKLRTGP